MATQEGSSPCTDLWQAREEATKVPLQTCGAGEARGTLRKQLDWVSVVGKVQAGAGCAWESPGSRQCFAPGDKMTSLGHSLRGRTGEGRRIRALQQWRVGRSQGHQATSSPRKEDNKGVSVPLGTMFLGQSRSSKALGGPSVKPIGSRL